VPPAFLDFCRDSSRGFRSGPETDVRGCRPNRRAADAALAEQAIQADCRIGAVIVVGPFGMGVDLEDWLRFPSRTGMPVILATCAKVCGRLGYRISSSRMRNSREELG
jgi:hypothetical protein